MRRSGSGSRSPHSLVPTGRPERGRASPPIGQLDSLCTADCLRALSERSRANAKVGSRTGPAHAERKKSRSLSPASYSLRLQSGREDGRASSSAIMACHSAQVSRLVRRRRRRHLVLLGQVAVGGARLGRHHSGRRVSFHSKSTDSES